MSSCGSYTGDPGVVVQAAQQLHGQVRVAEEDRLPAAGVFADGQRGRAVGLYSASTVACGSLTAIGRVQDLVLADLFAAPQALRDRVAGLGDLAAQAGVPGLKPQGHADEFAAFLGRRAFLVKDGRRVQPGQRLAGPLQVLPDRLPLGRRHAQGVQEQVQLGVREVVLVTSLCR